MIRILMVFGTRPEVIKMAPVIKELSKYPSSFTYKICVTAQHRQMIDPLLKLFNINPDYDLNIMQQDQSLEYITTAVIEKMKDILAKEKPDYLLVQGDTTTSMAASLAAFYQKVKICHIEAGLRTNNKYHPYPEEVNRRIIDSVSDLSFAHTQEAKDNLLKEGIPEHEIEVTGNTVIDALLDIANREYGVQGGIFGKLALNGEKVILVTAHRRENFGEPLVNICNAIKEVAKQYTSRVCFVYPVHLNPNVQKCVYPILGGIENVLLTAPLDYLPFVQLMKRSHFVLTDSGGLQEEAPSLGKPVLVMRQTTERPEGVKAGAVKVIGTNTEDIVRSITHLLEDKNEYQRMSKAVNPYGDGKASKRIVARFLKEISIEMNTAQTSPKVSIVLPVYNGEKYIQKSIESCLNQTYKNIELVIVNDGSKDRTDDIIKSFKDERIKYIVHKKNKRLPRALNTGFSNASGEYLTWTSADNQYLPEAIEEMLKFLIKDKSADFVYADYQAYFEKTDNRKLKRLPDDLDLKIKNEVGPCFLYGYKVFKNIGYFNPKFELVEDYDYWIRVNKRFKLRHYPQVLYTYTEHSESLKATKSHAIYLFDHILRYKHNYLSLKELRKAILNFFRRVLRAGCSKREAVKIYLKTFFKILNLSIFLCFLYFLLLIYFSLLKIAKFIQWTFSVNFKKVLVLIDLTQKHLRLKVTKNKINILCIVPYMSVGGSQKVVLNIAKAVSGEKFSFHIITTSAAVHTWRNNFSQYFTNVVTPLKIVRQEREFLKYFFKIIKKLKIDIVFISNSTIGYKCLSQLRIKFKSLKIVDLIHVEESPGAKESMDGMSTYFDKRICISGHLKNFMIDKYQKHGLGSQYIERLCVVRNGIDTREYTQESSKIGRFKFKYEIPNETKIIAFIGRFSSEKNPLLFVEIAKTFIEKKHPYKVKFVMAGDGREFDNLNNMIKKYNIKDYFILTGMIDNVVELLTDTDILLVVSKREGIPLVVLEAMAMQIQVISADVGAVNEAIEDAENGFLINLDNNVIESFCEKILSILSGDISYRRLSENARKAILSTYSLEAMGKGYENIFNEVLEQRHKKANHIGKTV